MKMIAICLAVVACATPTLAQGQPAQNQPKDPIDYIFLATVQRQKAARAKASKEQAAGHANIANAARDSVGDEEVELTPHLLSLVVQPSYRGFLSDLEQKRFDIQTGPESNAAGTTSLVSKGSVPALFGFAVENGAMTRSVSGTTITFRTSPANVYAALQKGGYIEAGPSIPDYDGSFESIAKRASFSVSFDTSRGNTTASNNVFTGDQQQLSGWSARYDIYNKRDPRLNRYKPVFANVMSTSGAAYINSLTGLANDLSQVRAFTNWQNKWRAAALSASDDELLNTLKAANEEFKQMIEQLKKDRPDLAAKLQNAADLASQFALARANAINQIMQNWTLAVEYNLIKQANTNGTLPSSATTAIGGPIQLPDLGTINLVTSRGFSDGPQFTANASFTWFQNIPAGLSVGRLRDAQVSAQLDFPLKEIHNIGKPTLSVAGQFLALLEEPLGQKIIVNTVEVSRTGNIGLVQGKITVPTKNTGLSIPISVTWANRTELIKESDIRGNIGVSFDLDKLFAKP